MNKIVGMLNIEGDPTQIALVEAALAKCNPKVENLPKSPVKVKFGTTPLIGVKRAWGFTSKRTITLNAKMAERRPYRIKAIVVHELGHILDADYGNPQKRQELMALMLPVTTQWAKGPYAKRGCEAFADAFAEAVGIASPLDTFYSDIADKDLPKVLTILLGPDPASDPPPDPVPLPLPDPTIPLKQAISTAYNALEAVYPFSTGEV